MYYKRSGIMPGGAVGNNDPSLEAQTAAAFSSKQEDEYDGGEMTSQPSGADYGLLHQHEADNAHEDNPYAHSNESRYNVMQNYETSYGGAYGGESHAPGDQFRDDLHLSHDQAGYTNQPVRFPSARYDA